VVTPNLPLEQRERSRVEERFARIPIVNEKGERAGLNREREKKQSLPFQGKRDHQKIETG